MNCKKMVEELYKQNISTIPQLDARLKNNIVNIFLGALEKTMNKRSNSFVFDSTSEALYYQELIGGRLAILNKYQVEKGGKNILMI